MSLVQMEFDFPEPKKPEKVSTFLVELTRGWDGEPLRELNVTGTLSDATAAVREMAESEPKCSKFVDDVWTYTFIDKSLPKRTVCDFGSWTHFGRITRK